MQKVYYKKPLAIYSPKNYVTSGEALKGVEKVIHNNEYLNIREKTKRMLVHNYLGGIDMRYV